MAHSKEPDITDYNYMGSAIGNAYFSGLTFNELWMCLRHSETPAELDAAVSATIRLKEMVSE